MHRTIPFGAICSEPRVPAECQLADARLVKTAAARLRRQVSCWVGDSPTVSDHLLWLARNGFDREDRRQIRYTVEVFYSCEPIFAIAHALGARLRSQSVSLTSGSDGGLHFVPDAVTAGLIPLPQDSQKCTAAHPFFRALSKWPGYGEMVSHDLVGWHALPELVISAMSEAKFLASRIDVEGTLPQTGFTSSDSLLAACEIVVITSCLRQMFVNAELQARSDSDAGWLGG